MIYFSTDKHENSNVILTAYYPYIIHFLELYLESFLFTFHSYILPHFSFTYA